MNWKGMGEGFAEKGRPQWGFCRVKVETLCRLWSAYREDVLQRQDVQTWFGVHELLMRRCTLPVGRKPNFSVEELQPLTGLRALTIRASIRRLEARGFLSWSEHQIVMKDGCTEVLATLMGLAAMLAAVTNNRRTLPIPRHTVLLLARTRRPVFLATILGHLFRGMYYRSRECCSWGTCKSSWIAAAFGVDIRNVKAARGELERIGWLRQLDSNHWHRQRHGGSFVISLAWPASKADVTRPILPPRNPLTIAKSPPPESYRNLPSGINNQKRQKTSGVQGQRARGEGEPQLRHVLPVDLVDPQRTAELFDQAVRAGRLKDGFASRLQFFAAAKRASRIASNPGGFFVTVLNKQLWRNIALCDEEAARSELVRMPDFAYGRNSTECVPMRPIHSKTSQLADCDSMDATVIRELVRHSLASVA